MELSQIIFKNNCQTENEIGWAVKMALNALKLLVGWSLADGTYSRVPCAAPWCVAVCCIGLSPAHTRWSRWMNLSRIQAPPRMDIPVSCKHTLPWPGQLGHAHIQRQNHTAFPYSLQYRKRKRRHIGINIWFQLNTFMCVFLCMQILRLSCFFP